MDDFRDVKFNITPYIEDHVLEVLYHCDEALTIDPDNITLYQSRAAACVILKQWHNVLTQCEEILTRDAASTFAYATRGLARAQLGDYTGGLDDIERSLALDPSFTLALDNRAHVESLMRVRPTKSS